MEVRSAFDWLKDGRLVTTLGIDERLRSVGGKIDTLDFFSRRPLVSSSGILDRKDQVLGVYVQQTYVPTRWLSLNGGSRIDNENRICGGPGRDTSLAYPTVPMLVVFRPLHRRCMGDA